MSRPARNGPPSDHRERLKYDFARAAPLRDLYPLLAEMRIDFRFEDGAIVKPSPQSFAYFPAARGFFRFACPCHACSGEFDLSAEVAALAARTGPLQRSQNLQVTCTGQRSNQASARLPCPVHAEIHVSATLRDAG